MLNDLAENDPKGYEEFLQTQMEEAKKERENRSGVLSPSQPVIVLSSRHIKRAIIDNLGDC